MSEENKFDFSEEENTAKENTAKENTAKENIAKDEAVKQSKKAVHEDAKGLLQSIKQFFSELLDFREDTDRDATIEAIKLDIPFKGATAWILICSIFVASVGLNANSTAVVIGAMLISPLMGPILGIGLSVAINDIDTLKKSLINFGVMILLSVLTAFLFFKFFPLQEQSSELLARTKPDIRDVLIAFFGGLALIIARTKRGTIASVIFGVAIATALMPPLCTVGYGLAYAMNDDFSVGIQFATGAMYLFTINTIFIALATFLVLKVLRFPMLKYANSAKRKRISRLASFVAILVMIPAVLTFLNVLRESNFKNDAKRFIAHELEALPNANYIKKNATIIYNPTEISTIELTTFGADEIPEATVAVLEQRFNNYNALKEAKLQVNQVKNRIINNLEYMEELRTRDSLDMMTQQQKITYLEDKVRQLSKFEHDYIPFEELSQEVKINYETVEQFSYANVINSNFSKIDTLSVFTLNWNYYFTTPESRIKDKKKLESWLKLKLKLDTLVVQ
jgi:uncharacterized hydrophobic protein (TIGR00271 family)